MRCLLFGTFAAFFNVAHGIELPSWTGPYSVGVSQQVFNKTTLNDPTAPDGTGSSYLATFYYPTSKQSSGSIPYIASELAAIYENLYSYPKDSLANLTSKIQPQSPVLSPNASLPPCLIFGPGGGGPPSALYQALLADLASHGHFVAALDHPYEQPFVQYPNGGPGIVGLDPAFEGNETFYQAVYEFRVSDTIDFVQQFPVIAQKFGSAAVNTTHYVLFGHSLGGAASVGAMMQLENINNVTVLGAINMDGQFFGAPASNVIAEANAKKPVFLFGSQGHDFTIDPTWLTFPLSQSGWWREVNVIGARHIDFSDITFWKGFNASTSQSIGIIGGSRMTQIVSKFVRDFVGFVTGGEPGVLEAGSLEYPEASFLGGS